MQKSRSAGYEITRNFVKNLLGKHLGTKFHAKLVQVGPKTAQDSPKMGQDGPKIRQDAPKIAILNAKMAILTAKSDFYRPMTPVNLT